ncbi:hypothetical protein [Nonomuraea sp. NPDC005650]|uniref:hypothetical protein n=1 Tax=Nonomuraea sp. NPDC005650 TaxID=3157045 RepID=UPI0033B6289F
MALAPLTLLVPELRAVPYAGGTDVLDDLVTWATAPGPTSVRLVSGPAGTGKTRLAVEPAARLLSKLSDRRAWRAMVALARSAADHPEGVRALAAVLGHDLAGLQNALTAALGTAVSGTPDAALALDEGVDHRVHVGTHSEPGQDAGDVDFDRALLD